LVVGVRWQTRPSHETFFSHCIQCLKTRLLQYCHKIMCTLWRMAFSGTLHRVALVRTDVSEEFSASFIRVTRIGELGTTLAVTSNPHML
jgi:hypothetical protein